MKIGLFVEGSTHEGEWLKKIWADCLVPLSGMSAEIIVYGISKANVVAMDSSVRNLSSTVEPLDALISRMVARDHFEAVIVCWDLVPKWNSHDKPCRWRETLDFYSSLSDSEVLPDVFRDSASRRLEELKSRSLPSARRNLPRVAEGSVQALIMDPMFEAMILSESAFRRALGLDGPRPKGWPKTWGTKSPISPDKVLSEAIAATRRMRPRPPVLRRINKGFESAKNEWGHFLLVSMMDNDPNLLQESEILDRLSQFKL